MVLVQDTDMLPLGRPMTYLDLHHRLRVLETVRQLSEKCDMTITVVLHDITQATRPANYLVAMQDDEPYDWGSPREVVTEELPADVSHVEVTIDYSPSPETAPKRLL